MAKKAAKTKPEKEVEKPRAFDDVGDECSCIPDPAARKALREAKAAKQS